jgi:signal transduction histidine kinase
MEDVLLREALGSRPGVAHQTIHGPDDLITSIVPLVDAPFDVQGALVARLDQPTAALLWPMLRQRAPELWPGVLATLAFAGVVGSGFGWLTARWLTRRMDRLLFAADAWRAGDFSVTADDRSADEVGHLARQMNLMAADVQTLMQVRQEVAALHERQRIARDLHDAVTQTLFSASMVAGVLPRLYARNPEEGARRAQEVAQLSRGALAEMRTLLLELRPAALQQAKLPDLLEQLALAARGRGQFAVEVQADERATLPTEAKIACYRIVQEALNNGIKHAHARHVTIALHREADSVTLRVTDDGCGFDPARVPPDRLGHQTMRERAAASGATFQLDSQPGAGTCVCVRWPFPESEEPDE